MKSHDLALRPGRHNLEMAFAFGLPVGAGLFAAVYASDGGLRLAAIMGAVALLAVFTTVLFLMRPLQGTVTLDQAGLRVASGSVRLVLPFADVEWGAASRWREGLPKDARLVAVTDHRRVVRLPLRDGGAVFLSPAAPERFLDACHLIAAQAEVTA